MSVYELAKSLFNQKEVERNTSSNTVRYGTVTQENQNGKIKAILDGSSVDVVLSCETPVSVGQRITVTNSNGVYRVIALSGVVTQLNETTLKADTGYTYISSLLAQEITASNLIANYGYVDTLKASDIYADDLIAANAYINELKAENIDAESLAADHADIGTLTTKVGFIDSLTAEHITAADIIADHASVDTLETKVGYIDTLNAGHIEATDIIAGVGYIGDLTASSVEASDIVAGVGYINDLTSESIEASDIAASVGFIGDLTASSIEATDIIADHATIDTLDSTYLQADFANIEEGAFETFYSESGLLTNAQMVSGVITGTLDATNVTIAHLDVGDLTVNTINGQTVPTAKSAQDIIDDLYDYNPTTGVITYSAGAQIASLIDNIEDIQSQIDGSISTWFYDVPPSLTNPPASTWTTDDEKDIHLGDLYYDTDSGYCYRWMVSDEVYSWQKISDSDVTAAMSLASEAKDLADNKRRVFYSTPIPPYDEGDLWSGGSSGDLKICTTAKGASGSFANSDWSIATKYTDDTAANELETNLGTSGGVSINADNISAGTIDASQVTVANLNASNITSGTLAAARISAQSISTSKLLMSNPENYCLMSEHDPETLGRDGAVLTTDGWIAQSYSETQNTSYMIDLAALCLYNPEQEEEFQLTATVLTEANSVFRFFYATLEDLDPSNAVHFWLPDQSINIPANVETRVSLNLVLSDNPDYNPQIEKYGCFRFLFTRSSSSGNVNAKIKNIHIYKKASADLIVDGAITANKISSSAVTSDKIAAGAITSAKIDAGAINATHIEAGSITADLLDADDIYGQNITITGDFNLGGNGALSYDSATDGLEIKASDITIASTSVLDKLEDLDQKSLYGTCSTIASVVAKSVVIPGVSSLTPTVGMHLYVLFSKANTANAPTIKIGTGPAYPIRTNMSGAFDKSFGSWRASSLVSFTFTSNSSESFWLIDSGEALEKAAAAIKDLSNFRTEIQQTARDITIQMNEYALKDSVDASIDSLNNKANTLGLDVENLTSAISVTSTGGVPKITLLADPAAESGTIYTEITNSEIAFVESGTKVSYINNKKLNISNASIEGELNFGNYVLKRRSNDHLTLVYAG